MKRQSVANHAGERSRNSVLAIEDGNPHSQIVPAIGSCQISDCSGIESCIENSDQQPRCDEGACKGVSSFMWTSSYYLSSCRLIQLFAYRVLG